MITENLRTSVYFVVIALIGPSIDISVDKYVLIKMHRLPRFEAPLTFVMCNDVWWIYLGLIVCRQHIVLLTYNYSFKCVC